MVTLAKVLNRCKVLIALMGGIRFFGFFNILVGGCRVAGVY